jgi:DNA repair exonuclease SbcCD nuclease subunit
VTSFRFSHISDVHLGYQQYGLPERFRDFSDAWKEAVSKTLEAQVDFVLIGGDLFEKRNTDPLAYEHAQRELARFREANVPVIAIEGNHDRYIHNREHSWLRVLASQGYLTLLDAIDRDGKVSLAPYDPDTQLGAYVDLPNGVRIVGLRYRGERLGRDIKKLHELMRSEEHALPPAEYSILMCHTGVQRETEFPAGRGYVHLPVLMDCAPSFDYVAVGHIHYARRYEEFVFQPGSLENCSSEEAHPERIHGFFLVEADARQEGEERTVQNDVTLHEVTKRPFVLLTFMTDEYDTNESLQEGFAAFVAKQETHDVSPLVEVTLEGLLHFPRFQLHIKGLEQTLQTHFSPLHIRIRNKCADPGDIEVVDVHQTREELELQVLIEAFRDGEIDDERAKTLATLAVELKQMALTSASADDIIDTLDRAMELEQGWQSDD